MNDIAELAAELRNGSRRGTDTCILAADMLERMNAALDGLLEYVSTTEEAKRWNSSSTPGAVVAAAAALVCART